MVVEYDLKYNIGYIKFKEETEPVNSIKISDDMVIDVSSNGTIYGIELLNLKEQLFGDNLSRLILLSENSGEKREMEIPL